MPFAATWMDLENITLGKGSQKEKKILYDITYKKNVKKNSKESIYKTETDSQAEKTNS